MQISTRSQLLSARRNPQKAGQVLEGLFPGTHTRGLAITILVDAIRTAARTAPRSWGVSLFPERLCLNVGRGAILQLCPNRIVFIVTASWLEGLPRKARLSFRDNQTYRFIPDAMEGSLADKKLDRYAVFRSAHMDLIERAAQNRKVCFWPSAHSPGVIEYIRSIGYAVPPAGTCADSETEPRSGQRAHAPARPAYRDYGEAPDDNLDELQRFAARVRKGQPKFRQNLLRLYGGKCAITGGGPSVVLEATHIWPYAEAGINRSSNGLLLRADIHTLFDTNLLRIHPNTLQIQIDLSLKETEYWRFNGQSLRERRDGRQPGQKYLRMRWDHAGDLRRTATVSCGG